MQNKNQVITKSSDLLVSWLIDNETQARELLEIIPTSNKSSKEVSKSIDDLESYCSTTFEIDCNIVSKDQFKSSF